MVTKEVVIAGGQTKSAQLLQISGVGPRQLSLALGVDPVVDLPVGENYQDHSRMDMKYNSQLPVRCEYVYLREVFRD